MRLVVFDDRASLLTLYRLLLGVQGYEVVLFPSLPQTPQEVEHQHPDLILLDAVFRAGPSGLEYEGFTFLQHLRAYPPTASLPVIIVTASVPFVLQYEPILKQERVPVLLKPFRVKELLDLVESMLSPTAFQGTSQREEEQSGGGG